MTSAMKNRRWQGLLAILLLIVSVSIVWSVFTNDPESIRTGSSAGSERTAPETSSDLIAELSPSTERNAIDAPARAPRTVSAAGAPEQSSRARATQVLASFTERDVSRIPLREFYEGDLGQDTYSAAYWVVTRNHWTQADLEDAYALADADSDEPGARAAILLAMAFSGDNDGDGDGTPFLEDVLLEDGLLADSLLAGPGTTDQKHRPADMLAAAFALEQCGNDQAFSQLADRLVGQGTASALDESLLKMALANADPSTSDLQERLIDQVRRGSLDEDVQIAAWSFIGRGPWARSRDLITSGVIAGDPHAVDAIAGVIDPDATTELEHALRTGTLCGATLDENALVNVHLALLRSNAPDAILDAIESGSAPSDHSTMLKAISSMNRFDDICGLLRLQLEIEQRSFPTDSGFNLALSQGIGSAVRLGVRASLPEARRVRIMTQLQDVLSKAPPKGTLYDEGLRYAMLLAKPSDAPRIAEFVRRYEGGFAGEFQMDIDKLMANYQESTKPPEPDKD